MSEENASSDKKQGFSFGASVALFVYVLSVGPAFRIFQHCENSVAWKAFDIFYAPVGWLMDTPLRAPLDWYIGLWTHRLPLSRILLP